jgi:hypothetical protein
VAPEEQGAGLITSSYALVVLGNVSTLLQGNQEKSNSEVIGTGSANLESRNFPAG